MGCPVPAGTIVEVICKDRLGFTMRHIGQTGDSPESSWDWRFFPKYKKVLRYRVKRPRGLSMLLENLQALPIDPSRMIEKA
jgi:hypothetical protein